jgi:hypothetical protein
MIASLEVADLDAVDCIGTSFLSADATLAAVGGSSCGGPGAGYSRTKAGERDQGNDDGSEAHGEGNGGLDPRAQQDRPYVSPE